MTNMLSSPYSAGLQCSRILVPSYTGPGMSTTRIRPLVSLPWVSGYWGPNTSLLPLVASVPLIIVSYCLVPRPMFVPKRRSQQGVVGSRAVMTEFIVRNSAFYRPRIALHWSITYHVTNTSLPVRDFSSRRTCIFNIDYFTRLSQLS